MTNTKVKTGAVIVYKSTTCWFVYASWYCNGKCIPIKYEDEELLPVVIRNMYKLKSILNDPYR